MDVDKRRVLAEAYGLEAGVAEHHIRSFNKFLTDGAHQIIQQNNPVRIDLRSEEDTKPYILEFSDSQIHRPEILEPNGRVHDLYPQEARLRNLTYAGKVTVDAQLSILERDNTKVKLDEDSVKLGDVPVMVRSSSCNLEGLTNEELIEVGEDPADPGGYFIVNGSERVVVPSEDLVPNRVIIDTEYDPNHKEQAPIVKTFSEYQGYRSIVTVQRHSQDRFLEVSFPEAPEELHFVTLCRVLGLHTDERIVEQFKDDVDIELRVLDLLERSEADSKAEAWKEIGDDVEPNKPGFVQRDEISQLIQRKLLPHLNGISENDERVRLAKGRHLCRMAHDYLKLELEKVKPHDKDHYALKRIQTVGSLIGRLFRTAVRRLTRDIDYQVWIAVDRNRNPTIDSVINSEVLTNRLVRSLSTGNWPGGRSGVSQLLDRVNHVAVVSHLHRLDSPLSRSIPHFEARDLHATQFGRICPSETPEGPSCGLTQNFAQSVELSSGKVQEDELFQQLESFGVRM